MAELAGGGLSFRAPRASLIALVVAVICAVPAIAGLWPWGLLLLLVPAAILWYVVRTGTFATSDGVVVRGPTYSRVVPRAEASALVVTAKGAVLLQRGDGSSILLPLVRGRDVPALRELLFVES